MCLIFCRQRPEVLRCGWGHFTVMKIVSISLEWKRKTNKTVQNFAFFNCKTRPQRLCRHRRWRPWWSLVLSFTRNCMLWSKTFAPNTPLTSKLVGPPSKGDTWFVLLPQKEDLQGYSWALFVVVALWAVGCPVYPLVGLARVCSYLILKYTSDCECRMCAWTSRCSCSRRHLMWSAMYVLCARVVLV